jgi:hypothetical protein
MLGVDRTGVGRVPGKARRHFSQLCDVSLRLVLRYVTHGFPGFMSAVSKKRVATAAYEHVEGIYGDCLEDPDVSDSKKIFGIPSATDGTTPQFMIRKKTPRNLRWI